MAGTSGAQSFRERQRAAGLTREAVSVEIDERAAVGVRKRADLGGIEGRVNAAARKKPGVSEYAWKRRRRRTYRL